MKSSKEQLESRGFAEQGIEVLYSGLAFDDKVLLLKSKIPAERTIGARLLKYEKCDLSLKSLITALAQERKLYAKIEICNTLICYGEFAVDSLISILGKIGNNQHKSVPDKEFKKNNYPLPRDIASRTLAYIGLAALPELFGFIKITNEKLKLSEAIDAIGCICFYYEPDHNLGIYECLEKIYYTYHDDNLVRWKVIRAMSALAESKSFLDKQLSNCNNNDLKVEIIRSLRIINGKNYSNL